MKFHPIPERARHLLIVAVLSLALAVYGVIRALSLRGGASIPLWEFMVAFVLTAVAVPVILASLSRALNGETRPARHRLRDEPPETGWTDTGYVADPRRLWCLPVSDFGPTPPTLWTDRATEPVTASIDIPLKHVDPVLLEAATAILNDRGKLPEETAMQRDSEYQTGRHHLTDPEDTIPHLFTNTDADLYGGFDRG